MEFNIAHFGITVRTDAVSRLITFLYASYVPFARVFRREVCSQGLQECPGCSRRLECIYHELFGQTLSTDPVALKRHQKPPLPFVFSFPGIKEERQLPQVEVELLLVGSAIQYHGLYVRCFERMLQEECARRKDVNVSVVQCVSYDYQKTPCPADDLAILDAVALVEQQACRSDTCALVLESPLRLVRDGRPLRTFDRNLFLMSVVRRVTSLAYYYSGVEFAVDFSSLPHLTAPLETIENEVFWHSRSVDALQSGLAGTIFLSGVPENLKIFLLLGAWLHVGKGASFGYGRYRMLPC